MRARTLLAIAPLALGALAASFFGCSATSSTAIVVGVSTQTRVSKDIRTVRVLVRTGETTVSCVTHVVGTGARALPQTEVITGRGGQDLTVTVAGYRSDPPSDCTDMSNALVLRTAHTHLVGGETLYLPMPLKYACFDTPCARVDGQTCLAGACTSAEVDSDTLVDYSDPLVFGTSSFCFPESRCFESPVPALLVDKAACVFQLTGGVTIDQGINVAVVHDNLSRELLDLDPREGFLLDPSKPDRFALAPALCTRFRERKISAVFAGAGCPSKTALNPLCQGDAPDGGLPAAEPPELCTSPAELAPTPSALYLLMDRSHSMAQYFGDAPSRGLATSFRETLDLALQWPVLRKTLVGFRFLPADAEDCTRTPNTYARIPPGTKDAVPFGTADAVHGAIAALLQPSAVDPLDRPIFLDAVLRRAGAYDALAQLGDASGFATRQLVVLGNRDLWTHCDPARGTPAELAAGAQRDLGIAAGTLLLSAPTGIDQVGRDPYLDAVTIARAGTGPFCDGTYDPVIAAGGVVAALSDLGSCLYDLPPELDLGDIFSAKISYFNFIASKRVDIPHSSLCSDAPSASNGWNLDRGRVRLCGRSCRDLRLLLKNGALYAIQHHAPPPGVEMKYAPRCKD